MIVLCEMLDDWLVRCILAKDPERGGVDDIFGFSLD